MGSSSRESNRTRQRRSAAATTTPPAHQSVVLVVNGELHTLTIEAAWIMAINIGGADGLALIRSLDAVDVNTVIVEGATPLIYAAQRGELGIANYLLSRSDIDVNHQNLKGATALILALEYTNFPDYTDEKRRACLAIADLLLARSDINVNLRTRSTTEYPREDNALCVAVMSAHRDQITKILNKGARISFGELVGFLESRVSDVFIGNPNVDLRSTNNNGESLLMWAASVNKHELIRSLLSVEKDRRPDINGVVSNGMQQG